MRPCRVPPRISSNAPCCAVHDWIGAEREAVQMIMQVHDELVFEVAADRIGHARAAIGERMAGAAELSVPLLVEAGEGANWDEAH